MSARAGRPGPLGRLRATRRSFLALAGAGAAWAGLAGLRLAPAAAAAPGKPGAPRFFAPRDRERLALAAERLVATQDPTMPELRATRALDTIDALCARLDPGLTGALPWLLWLVEWGPMLFDWTPARFSSLGPAERDAHLEGWRRSRFGWRRTGFLALRNLAIFGYYSRPETWPGIGYGGPLLGREEGRT